MLLRERPAQGRRVLERRERILQQEISAMQRADLEKDKARLALSRRELGLSLIHIYRHLVNVPAPGPSSSTPSPGPTPVVATSERKSASS